MQQKKINNILISLFYFSIKQIYSDTKYNHFQNWSSTMCIFGALPGVKFCVMKTIYQI